MFSQKERRKGELLRKGIKIERRSVPVKEKKTNGNTHTDVHLYRLTVKEKMT